MKKKFFTIVMAGMVAVMGTACGSGSTDTASSAAAESSASSAAETADVYAEDGQASGGITDNMHTMFFDFAVQNMTFQEQYADCVAEDGYQLVVCNVEITNTTEADVTMYDTDFQLDWVEDGETTYAWPTTYYDTDPAGDMLESEYTIAAGETKVGVLAYVVPDSLDSDTPMSLCYQEYYVPSGSEDEAIEGSLYVVDLTNFGVLEEIADSEAESAEAESAETESTAE